MTDVLVINHGLHHVCGVHDLGLRVLDAIPDSISKAYVEVTTADQLGAVRDVHRPAVELVNYRADLLPWYRPGTHLTVAVAHNYDPHTLAGLHARHVAAGFGLTMALEPWPGYEIPGVVWSGRPLPPPIRIDVPDDHDPAVGSFGFAFGHKRFDLVAREVSALGRSAMMRLHCPTAHFGGSAEQTEAVIASVRAELSPQVDLLVTTDHHPALEVVRDLAACHVNTLLYDPGQPDAGLSSALDYLLAAGRPILVSEASMFRHALPAALTYPTHSLAEILDNADQHAVNVRERYDQLSQGYVAGIARLLDFA